MKKTVQLLVSIAVLYLYGYTWKQKTLQTRIHGKWKHEQGCLTLRLDGIISWETADQKTVFGYYELKSAKHGKAEIGELPEAWILQVTIHKQRYTLQAAVNDQTMEIRKDDHTYHFKRT